jgi:hypothetical protein
LKPPLAPRSFTELIVLREALNVRVSRLSNDHMQPVTIVRPDSHGVTSSSSSRLTYIGTTMCAGHMDSLQLMLVEVCVQKRRGLLATLFQLGDSVQPTSFGLSLKRDT